MDIHFYIFGLVVALLTTIIYLIIRATIVPAPMAYYIPGICLVFIEAITLSSFTVSACISMSTGTVGITLISCFRRGLRQLWAAHALKRNKYIIRFAAILTIVVCIFPNGVIGCLAKVSIFLLLYTIFVCEMQESTEDPLL